MIVFVRMSDLLITVTTMTHDKVELALQKRAERERQRKAAVEQEKGTYQPEADDFPDFWRFYGFNIGAYSLLLITLVFIVAWGFCLTEHTEEPPNTLHFANAVYFVWITITTLGYSDGFVTTDASKILCTGFIFIGCGFFAAVLTHFSSLKEQRQCEMRHRKVVVQKLDLDFVAMLEITANDPNIHLHRTARDAESALPNSHDRLSFLITTLVHLNLASTADVLQILQYYDHMDINNDGNVSMFELKREAARITSALEDSEEGLNPVERLFSGRRSRGPSQAANAPAPPGGEPALLPPALTQVGTVGRALLPTLPTVAGTGEAADGRPRPAPIVTDD